MLAFFHSFIPYCNPFPSGVVGLAIARRLVLRHPERSTYLVERNSRVGEETR